MSELNLGGSTADPDRGAIRRTSVGGSMRMPPPPDLQDNQFSSARHSIDTSYAASNRSRSRHSTASSEAYSSFSEEPAIAPQPKKSGGLKSFLKTVKKAFVPSSGRKSSEGSRQQTELVLESTLRIDSAKRGRADGPDERLFSEFRAAMDEARNRDPDNSHAAGTVNNWLSALRGFSGWLQNQSGLTIAGLLYDSTLADHAAAFVAEGGNNRVHRALEVLRDFLAGNVRKSRPAAEDEHLIFEFKTAMDEARKRDPDTSHTASTVRSFGYFLRGFSVWLQVHPRYLSITELLDNNDSTQLAARAAAFVDEGGDERVHPALKLLLDSRAGNVRTRRTLAPYPDDARLIDGFCKHSFGPETTAAQRGTINKLASRQRGFSDWLRREGKPSIASRLNGNQEQIDDGLKDDFRAFKEANGPTGGGVALDKLQKYQRVVAPNEAWRMPPEQAGWPQQSGQSPVSGYDPDPLWDELSERGRLGPAGSSSTWSPQLPSGFDLNQWPTPEAGPSSSARARSAHIYSGLEPLVDLPSTPHELRDDAYSAPVWAGPSTRTRELPDIGHLLGKWDHGPRQASYVVIDLLQNSWVAPSQFAPQTSFLINGELYTAELQLDGEVHLTHHPGAWLGERQWLGDEHISRDYDLLRGELQQIDPGLAARTRLVDPPFVQLLRFSPARWQRHFRAIVRDGGHGSDTADFLFLPVNDASAANLQERGSHWSLLLVDRRDRENLVAYHYDSYRVSRHEDGSSKGYNHERAKELADRLGARLESPEMARQDNTDDCGVFVVDGTRALVTGLAQGLPQPQHLNNLVIDRRALQNRLRR
ncbi:Ulp1 family isopeptidase [Mesorhizobium sp. L-2-11]|uniref:Ulp1 family isopeptidase n=1 Tax=Mesorhizobium sp. L-2-11 TaxID=2744521 RepID=UPI001FD52237|nr:Ulp1 family isopeptidase [Mesorhizobium sp. L-2-11]